MKAHPDLLSRPEEIRALAESLQRHKIIAFDTEFIRETTFFPKVELIQVATDEESWLIDARAAKENLDPLFSIFKNKEILKVVHAAQGDQECLYTAFGVIATPTLDTAIAASLCGYGDGLGLGNLLKSVMNIRLHKGHARTHWGVRPLPPQLLEYAHADVEHLVLLGRTLMEQLEKLSRKEWALELSAQWEDRSLYESDPEAIAFKLGKGARLDRREYASLIELVRWREGRVRELNVPRRWVADDTVLLDLARVRPKDMAHLSTFRGINKGELKKSGEDILTALKSAADTKDVELPPIERTGTPTLAETQAIDLLRCYIGILADHHHIAVRHLMNASQLLPLLRTEAQSWKELLQQKILSSYAAQLIGEEVIALLSGKKALTIQRCAVQMADLPEVNESVER